jgi:2-(3-amino-3-carboxypropyl)histidine synthase
MGSRYDLELDKVVHEVKRKKCKRIVIQMPDGLMAHALMVSAQISQATGVETIISLDTCYGACDLATQAASRLGADLIVHYGHSPWMTKSSIPTLYIEAFSSADVSPLLPKTIAFLKGGKRIGLLSTVQYIHELGKTEEFLKKKGFEVFIGKASGRVSHAGQVLGCDYSSATSISNKVDKFLLIGAGEFHSIGIALETRKECIVVDEYSGSVFTTKELLQRFLRSRYACIIEARNANRFGVIIGLKYGQLNLSEAQRARKKLMDSGRTVTMFCVDDLDPERLNYIDGIEAFVVVACPRIAIDDAPRLKKPTLTPEELNVMLSDESLQSYLAPS